MTAIEWLQERISIGLTYEQEVLFEGLFDQAKEMEKEQSHAEYMRGWRDGLTKQGPPAPPLDRKIYK